MLNWIELLMKVNTFFYFVNDDSTFFLFFVWVKKNWKQEALQLDEKKLAIVEWIELN